MESLSQQAIKWASDKMKGRVTAYEPLKGGQSSIMHILSIDKMGEMEEVILREYDDSKWLEEEPRIARQEAQNLSFVQKLPICTPHLLAVDMTGESAGRPAVLMSKVEGKVQLIHKELKQWIRELARILFTIHSYPVEGIRHHYFPYYNLNKLCVPSWSTIPEKWQEMIERLKKSSLYAANSFIHRDYHPVNVLCNQKGSITGVVDWVNACIGPKEIDIGHCRINLTIMYGLDIANVFLEEYEKQADAYTYSSMWDLVALANFYDESPPEVYDGWKVFGLEGITSEGMIVSMEQLLTSALSRLD